MGTPGRVLDHLERGTLQLGELQWFILDEADRMLDMGFSEDVEKVVDYAIKSGGETTSPRIVPDRIQVLLFSATIPSWVREVMTKYMHPDKETVDLVTEKEKASVDVRHLVLRCPWEARAKVIADLIEVYCGVDGRAIVFCDMKKSCNELAGEECLRSIVRSLYPLSHSQAGVLHGDIPQKTREQTLKDFKDGKFRCLVATDVAARGLDIQGVPFFLSLYLSDYAGHQSRAPGHALGHRGRGDVHPPQRPHGPRGPQRRLHHAVDGLRAGGRAAEHREGGGEPVHAHRRAAAVGPAEGARGASGGADRRSGRAAHRQNGQSRRGSARQGGRSPRGGGAVPLPGGGRVREDENAVDPDVERR